MRMAKRVILFLTLVFFCLVSKAQTSLNGRFYISGVSENPTTTTSNFSIEGTFT